MKSDQNKAEADDATDSSGSWIGSLRDTLARGRGQQTNQLDSDLRRQMWKWRVRRWVRRIGVLAVIGGIIAAGMAFGPSLSPGTIYADNPWGSEPITVNVTYAAGPDATAEKALDAELKNWEENAPTWTNQTANFSKGVSKSQADLRVVFVSELDECGQTYDSRIAGCAYRERYEEGDIVDAEILIEMDHSYSDLRKIIRHEIGHLYGLEHSDSDRLPWMAESSTVVQ